MKFGVVQFPGSCDEVDALRACERVGEAELLWHGDHDLRGVDAVVVPGGFSYGDYLRVGSIARFSPVMQEVAAFAADGYEAGHGQPSFDKQYVRDWASGTGWDKAPPAPEVPADIVEGTRGRYVEAYEKITGEPFEAWLDRTAP